MDSEAAAPRLAVQGLVKRYGPHAALAGLSVALAPGQFVALLGPNGAGKSTLFQILTGLFAADEGDALVAGHSIRRAPVQALKRLGVVFQQMSLDLDLSVAANLRFHADLHGLPRAVATARADSPGATGARSNWYARCCTARRCC
jgi:ABC-2 type transport system ATP-binding protein